MQVERPLPPNDSARRTAAPANGRSNANGSGRRAAVLAGRWIPLCSGAGGQAVTRVIGIAESVGRASRPGVVPAATR
ncbi:hypothetical protein GCM10009827_023220 [Dactylosporangium maewongense]|uniref:Uncharacterized protein n=1 Tax=Dactylosporangium maewongense TaxID=634393 RepID=A0ABP4KV79_9ACTN